MYAVLVRAQEMIHDLLVTHREEITDAFLKAGEDEDNSDKGLTINIGVKIAPGNGPSQKKVTASLAFVKDRCKDSKSDVLDENQPNLPGIHAPKGKRLFATPR